VGNVFALILSFVLVLGIIAVSELMEKRFKLPKEESRKLVHIGVSHWWLLAMAGFTSWKWAIVPPIAFIALNLFSWYSGLFDAMERKPRDLTNLGTVYFPIALLLMVIFTWQDSPVLSNAHPYLGGLGIMAMGYGDGFAALVGSHRGTRKYSILGSTKSLEGSLTMFIAALIPLFFLILLGGSVPWLLALGLAALLSLLATIVEAVTPLGLDNLTVPFAVTLLACLILL